MEFCVRGKSECVRQMFDFCDVTALVLSDISNVVNFAIAFL